MSTDLSASSQKAPRPPGQNGSGSLVRIGPQQRNKFLILRQEHRPADHRLEPSFKTITGSLPVARPPLALAIGQRILPLRQLLIGCKTRCSNEVPEGQADYHLSAIFLATI
jgi:hypothetical protein